MRARCSSLAVLLLAFCVGGCHGLGVNEPLKDNPRPANGEQTLYQRIGGGPALAAIVDDVLARAVQDANVNFVRKGQKHTWDDNPDNLATLKMHLTEYFGMLTGGPQVYEGHDLLTTHTGMDISEGEWVSFMGDLRKTLDSMRIAQNDRDEFLRLAAGTHDAIVNH